MVPTRRIRLAVALGAGLIFGMLAAGSALYLERTQETARNTAATTLQHASLAVENTINRQLLAVDGALASLPALFSIAGIQNGEIDQRLAPQLLQTLNVQAFAFRDLLLVRPDGTLWAAARPRPTNLPLPLELANANAARQPGGVAIAGPTYNPLTGSQSWFLSRPVSLPGLGQLQAVAEIPLPVIEAQLSPMGNVPGLRIYVERPDGVLLASLPHDERTVGKQHVPLTGYLKAGDIADLLPPEIMAAPTIGVRRNTLYPEVRVALTLDLSTTMAGWYRDRKRVLIALSVTELLVLALAASVYVSLRQRDQVERERRKSREMLDSAVASMSDGFVMWDEQDRLLVCNQRYRDIYAISGPFIRPGARFDEIIREGARLGQYPQAGDDIEAFVREAVAWHHDNRGSLERLLPGGKWVLVTERRNPTGGIVGIRTDITTLKQALSDLADANERARQAVAEVQLQNAALMERDCSLRTQNMLFTAALNNMSQGLLMADSDRKIIVCNARFADMFRISAAQAASGTTTAALFHSIEANSGLGAGAAQDIHRQQHELAVSQRPGTFVTIDGDRLALAISQRPLPDGGWLATYEDVTEHQRAEGRIKFMAHHDALTQLPNRTLFRNRLDEALREQTGRGEGVALLYIDLDRFKYVNDTLGHTAGDALLEAAARRLQSCVRHSDIVARLGGDEFAIIYTSLDLPSDAIVLAERVIDVLSGPYQIGQRRVKVGASIGIAIPADPLVNGDTLLRSADMALYQAKANGRGTYCIFEGEMEARLNARLTIEADLCVALEQGQFELLYQPIFDLNSARLCAFEALVRWNHPTGGTVFPGRFIPIAEELGIIKSIGAWIFRQACADATRLPKDVAMAINLSPVQLEDEGIVGMIEAALGESGLDPARLEVEITETALLNNSAATIGVLHRMHRLGVSVALDDFGTGYSSLSYLRSFPFDKIKIDRLFVSEMAAREDCAAIVSSIVGLAAKLGMTTTAEGVETDEQFDLVRNAGCTTVQGYLLGRPQPIRKVIEYFVACSDGTASFCQMTEWPRAA